MEALSGIRIAHCSFHCGRHSLVAKQELVLIGLHRRRSSVKYCKNGYLRAVPKLRASVQDGTTTENTETVLEEVPQTEKEEDVNNNVMASEGSMVEVTFVLEKKCKFGQRFNIVGNDPLFGDWDVEAAVPMTWADGHIWTVNVDVPAEKQFEFKFVLTGEQGEVVWQPGANRLFQTEGGISSLVVKESWDSVDGAAAAEMEEERYDPLSDTSTTLDTSMAKETNELQVPVDISGTNNVSKDEIVEALESKDDGTDGHPAPTESGVDVAPEVPLTELDLAATAVKSMVGGDDTA